MGHSIVTSQTRNEFDNWRDALVFVCKVAIHEESKSIQLGVEKELLSCVLDSTATYY